MDRLTIHIQNKEELKFLEDLLNRLNIHFQKSNENGISKEEQDKRDWEIIMKGAHDDNFEEFYAQWKEDRKDPPEPYRS